MYLVHVTNVIVIETNTVYLVKYTQSHQCKLQFLGEHGKFQKPM